MNYLQGIAQGLRANISSILTTHRHKEMKQRAVIGIRKNHKGERINLSCVEQTNELWWMGRPIQGNLAEGRQRNKYFDLNLPLPFDFLGAHHWLSPTRTQRMGKSCWCGWSRSDSQVTEQGSEIWWVEWKIIYNCSFLSKDFSFGPLKERISKRHPWKERHRVFIWMEISLSIALPPILRLLNDIFILRIISDLYKKVYIESTVIYLSSSLINNTLRKTDGSPLGILLIHFPFHLHRGNQHLESCGYHSHSCLEMLPYIYFLMF